MRRDIFLNGPSPGSFSYISVLSKQLIEQIDALDETIKKQEQNLHFLANSFKSILPKFHKTFNSTIIQGEETDGTFYSSKGYEQALIIMSLTSIVILIIMQCMTLKRNKTIIQHQPIPKFSPKPFLHIKGTILTLPNIQRAP